jgi:hypothetical protein
MPTNLNAIIRYKQIDACLRNQFIKATIELLQEKCSEQLGEFRGIYKHVSERTIRDDIRIMRSNALGFNAPIVVNDGVYTYSNENYSIFNSPINELDLLKQILLLLLAEKDNIKSVNLQNVINSITKIVGENDILSCQIQIEKEVNRDCSEKQTSRLFKREVNCFHKSEIQLLDENLKTAHYNWKSIFDMLK